MHTESAAALRHHVGDLADRHHGGIVEEGCNLRVLLHEFSGHQHVLAGAYDPLWNKVAFLVFRVLAVIFKESLPADALGHLCRFFDGHLISFSQLSSVKLDRSLLFKVEHELDFFCCEQLVEQPEVGLIIADFLWLSRHAKIICNQCGQLPDQLLPLFVFHLISFRQIVPVIKKVILKSFGYHRFPLSIMSLSSSTCNHDLQAMLHLHMPLLISIILYLAKSGYAHRQPLKILRYGPRLLMNARKSG